MRVHPVPPRKRNGTFGYGSGGAGNQKNLRRLPHIFSKVLELPLSFDAHVSVSESPAWLRFAASAGGSFLSPVGVQAHAVEIHPGVMKVVVRVGGGGGAEFDEEEEEMDLDRWRFRLPDGTRPRLATAECVDGELVVTVPKGFDGEDGVMEGAVFGQMLLVQ
ncbi:uncharacterized protein M6B38_413930 [Iris pallida]|uniref:SHSP domain-containing protein n=1 Tax=Iris pallida TaxID=29817 RepID=A0AAX6FKU7_IRIPA|nr:uncharacterized protein M6B38_413930 [Iris pallida]